MNQEKALWSLEALSQVLLHTDLPFSKTQQAVILHTTSRELQLNLTPRMSFPVYLSLSGHQIVTSILLWPCQDKKEAKAFEARMLRSHKHQFPLAALSISEYNGIEWYELFGSMAKESDLSVIVTEIKTMMENALILTQQEQETIQTPGDKGLICSV